MSRRFRCFRSFCPTCTSGHASVESLERRSLLAVTFTAGPYAIPVNRPDLQYGPPLLFTETIVRINPHDHANVVSGVLDAWAVSTDGFSSLSVPPNVFPMPPGATGLGGDPDFAFDAQGRLFRSNHVRFPGRIDVAIVEVNPATGAVIAGPFLIPSTANTHDDKSFIVADSNPDSPYANNLYAVWARKPMGSGEWEVYFARSTDHGQTWTLRDQQIQLSDFDGPNNIPNDGDDEGWCWVSDVGVAPNGDVYVAYHSQPEMNALEFEGPAGIRRNPDGTSGKTFVLRSTDGGETFGPKLEAFPAGTSDVTFNVQDAVNGGTIPGTQFLTVGTVTPYVLADPARPGNVYIISNDDSDNVHGSGDDADVVIARSTDNGATWTSSTVVSGPSNSFQIFPFTAIDRFGNIVLAWYDNRRGLTNPSGRFVLDLMATYSTDGGATWAPEFRLNDIPYDPDPAAVNKFTGPPPTTRIGEYFGIDVYGGTAHVAFGGNLFTGPTPTAQAYYYGSFAIAGTLTVTGDDGASNDVISINPLAGNANVVEVVVNGQRQYAGLFEGLSGITIDAGGGTDTININATGAAMPITILPSNGNDVVNINVAGAGAASVVFADTMRLATLSIGAGGEARIAPGGSRALTVASLTLTGSAALDLTDNSLIVDYTSPNPLAQVRAALSSGYTGGAWTGPGIRSSTAASTANRALGYAEATDLFTTFPAPFAGQQVDNSSILVTYTRYGDADLNRVVNLNDFNRVAANFGQSNRRWSQGDFTFDGLVNLDDFNRLAANFGLGAGAAPSRPGLAGRGSTANHDDDPDLLD